MATQFRLFGLPDVDLAENKYCDCCHEHRPHSSFDRDPNTNDEFDHRCKDCKSNRARLHKYGLSQDDYNRMVWEQEDSCAICLDSTKKLVIDHDHKSGKVRGLLCGNCNSGLGFFGDSPRRLRTSIEYLKKSMDKNRQREGF